MIISIVNKEYLVYGKLQFTDCAITISFEYLKSYNMHHHK